MSVEKALFGQQHYRMLRAALDAAALRQRVVADNIANSETPGFTPREVRFEEFLNQVVSGKPALSMAATDSHHLTPGGGVSIPAPQVVEATPPDPASGQSPGDFDLERAMAELNENKVQYQALVTMISGRLMGLRNSIESK